MINFFLQRGTLILVLFWLLAYVTPLGWRPLVQPDELRFGEIAREMLATGDWVVPHLGGLRYFDKLPLGHWLNASSLALFGENAFAIRFASCVSMGLCAAAIWHFTRRYARSRDAGTIAALVFLSCPGALAMGNYATLDGFYTLLFSLTLMAFYHASLAPSQTAALGRYALCGVLLGLAFMTNGLLAPIMATGVALLYMLWEGRARELLRYGGVALAVAAGLSLPWALAIAGREPDFWPHYLSVDYIHSVFSGEVGQAESVGFYLSLLLLITFPWLFLFVGKPYRTLLEAKLTYVRRLTRFCVSWIAPSLGMFLAAESKLPMYVLPCLIPMAVMLGVSAAKLIVEQEGTLFQTGIQLSRGLLVLALLTAVLNFTAGLGTPAWRAHETVQWVWLCAALMIWIGILRLGVTAQLELRHWIVALGAIPVFTLLPLYMPELIYAGRMPGQFLREQASAIEEDTLIATDSTLLSSASWYFRRTDVYLVGSEGEYAYGLSYPDSRPRHIPSEEFENFIAATDRPVAYFDKFGGKPPPNNLPSGASEGVMGRFILFRYYPPKD